MEYSLGRLARIAVPDVDADAVGSADGVEQAGAVIALPRLFKVKLAVDLPVRKTNLAAGGQDAKGLVDGHGDGWSGNKDTDFLRKNMFL